MVIRIHRYIEKSFLIEYLATRYAAYSINLKCVWNYNSIIEITSMHEMKLINRGFIHGNVQQRAIIIQSQTNHHLLSEWVSFENIKSMEFFSYLNKILFSDDQHSN